MSAADHPHRELAHRASNGVEVRLFWLKLTNTVSVEVVDPRLDESFEFEVDGSHALSAFNHPYAYAVGHKLVVRRHNLRAYAA